MPILKGSSSPHHTSWYVGLVAEGNVGKLAKEPSGKNLLGLFEVHFSDASDISGEPQIT